MCYVHQRARANTVAKELEKRLKKVHKKQKQSQLKNCSAQSAQYSTCIMPSYSGSLFSGSSFVGIRIGFALVMLCQPLLTRRKNQTRFLLPAIVYGTDNCCSFWTTVFAWLAFIDPAHNAHQNDDEPFYSYFYFASAIAARTEAVVCCSSRALQLPVAQVPLHCLHACIVLSLSFLLLSLSNSYTRDN